MTVRIRLLVRLFHLGDDLAPGTEMDVDADLARALVDAGVAEVIA